MTVCCRAPSISSPELPKFIASSILSRSSTAPFFAQDKLKFCLQTDICRSVIQHVNCSTQALSWHEERTDPKRPRRAGPTFGGRKELAAPPFAVFEGWVNEGFPKQFRCQRVATDD